MFQRCTYVSDVCLSHAEFHVSCVPEVLHTRKSACFFGRYVTVLAVLYNLCVRYNTRIEDCTALMTLSHLFFELSEYILNKIIVTSFASIRVVPLSPPLFW